MPGAHPGHVSNSHERGCFSPVGADNDGSANSAGEAIRPPAMMVFQLGSAWGQFRLEDGSGLHKGISMHRGVLKHGNPAGDPSTASRCGANETGRGVSRARHAKPQNGSLHALSNARGVFHWTPNAGGSRAMPQGAMEARAPLGQSSCSPQATSRGNAQNSCGVALLEAFAVTPEALFKSCGFS